MICSSGPVARNAALATLCLSLACTASGGGGSNNGSGGNGSGGDNGSTGGAGDANGGTSGHGGSAANGGSTGNGGASGGSNGNGGSSGAGGAMNLGGSAMGGARMGGAGGAMNMGGSLNMGGMNLGGAPAGRVPMFVALGEQARTIISCDDGQHWIADQKELTLADNRVTPNGISFGVDGFILSMGHGAPPTIRRSEDGITWTTVLDGVQRNFPYGYEHIAYGNNTFVTGGGHVSVRSTDDGKTWSAQQASMLSGDILRKMGFGDTMGGRFVAAGGTRAVYSDDGGLTWKAPAAYCAGMSSISNVLYGNGTFVVTDTSGRLCVSKDGGNNWTVVTVTNLAAVEVGLFTDGQLSIYGTARVWKSADGMTWTPTTLVPNTQRFSAITRGASGTFAGVLDGDKFYRSPDGITWTRVATGNFTAGNNLAKIAFGFARPSAMCPAQ